MPELKMSLQSDRRLAFFQGFLRRPKQVGSVIPSSRFMERRIVHNAAVREAPVIVELGPGTGGTTRAMLRSMAPEATLLSIEINPDFVSLLEQVPDPRLVVHEGSAEQIAAALTQHGLDRPAAVVSGIPFSTMPVDVARRVLRSVEEVLAPGGRFVAYQVRDRVHTLGREVFGDAEVEMELLNIPPMRIYRWHKPHPAEGEESSSQAVV